MNQQQTANSIAAELVAAADAGNVTAPASRTHAIAAAAVADAEKDADALQAAEYGEGGLASLAGNTTTGALTQFAMDLNENASYDGREWCDNAFDTNAILDKLAQAVIDRRNGK